MVIPFNEIPIKIDFNTLILLDISMAALIALEMDLERRMEKIRLRLARSSKDARGKFVDLKDRLTTAPARRQVHYSF
jgi:hypothetical protein